MIQHQLHPAELDAFDTTTRMITKSEKVIDADETSGSLSLNRGGEGV